MYTNNFLRHNEEQVTAAWSLLEAIRRANNANWNNLEAMQLVMREFAVTLITQQPYPDRIVVGNQTVIKFPTQNFASKKDYVNYIEHHHNAISGDDPLLFATFEALGYQLVMHLHGTHLPPYMPFVQQCSDTPLRCDIVNYGAAKEGFHWELQGQKNPSNGNCMYYSIAQQIQKDYQKVIPKIDEDQILEVQENLKVIKNSEMQNNFETVKPLIQPQEHIREDNRTVREIEKEFAIIEKPAQARKAEALQMLNTFNTSDLADIYKHAMQSDGEYLIGRLKEFAKENGVDPANNVLQTAVDTGNIDGDLEALIRNELLHALSVEAWRSPTYFNTLKSITNPTASCAEEGQEHLGIPTYRPTLSC